MKQGQGYNTAIRRGEASTSYQIKMPIVPIEKREDYKAIIRRILTMNPSMTAVGMTKQLAEASQPIILERHYVAELIKEVRADRITELDSETKESLYTEVKDLVEYINNQLRAIAQEEKLVYTKNKDGVPTEKAEVRIFAQQNRIKALKAVVENTLKLAGLKMDLGIIERKHGTMEFRVIDMMAGIKKIRNGNYSTPLKDLIAVEPRELVAGGADK